MSASGEDIFRLIGYVQDDLRGVQAKLVEIRTWLAAMDLPAVKPMLMCPVGGCGIERPNDQLLAEHLENVHGIR